MPAVKTCESVMSKNHQAIKRLRWYIIGLAVALGLHLLLGCSNQRWTKGEIGLEVAWQVVNVVDGLQTAKIAREPGRFKEYNSVLGEHPGQGEVLGYFAAGAVLHAMVSGWLPRQAQTFGVAWKPRKWWQVVTIGTSGACVGRNLQIGLGIGF